MSDLLDSGSLNEPKGIAHQTATVQGKKPIASEPSGYMLLKVAH